MKYEIKHCLTGEVQFTAEIEADVHSMRSLKMRLAVDWAIVNGADLRNVDLSGADLCGFNLSRLDMRGTNLRGAHMANARMHRTDLTDANLTDVDFTGTDMRDAFFMSSNLTGANFRNAILRDTRLYLSCMRDVDLGDFPVVIENIHQKVYAAASKDGALNMSYFHYGTSHCHAGWVVTLAGDGGKVLEWAYGTPTAAALIYAASDPSLEKIPSFHGDSKDALADMKRLAELEAAKSACN